MPPTPRLRRFVLCVCPRKQRNLLAFLVRTAGYEALEARCVDDALRMAENQFQGIAAVLYCELTPYDTGALAQLRSQLPGIPFVVFAEDRQFIADRAVVIRSASELIAYLAELRNVSHIKRAA